MKDLIHTRKREHDEMYGTESRPLSDQVHDAMYGRSADHVQVRENSHVDHENEGRAGGMAKTKAEARAQGVAQNPHIVKEQRE